MVGEALPTKRMLLSDTIDYNGHQMPGLEARITNARQLRNYNSVIQSNVACARLQRVHYSLLLLPIGATCIYLFQYFLSIFEVFHGNINIALQLTMQGMKG